MRPAELNLCHTLSKPAAERVMRDSSGISNPSTMHTFTFPHPIPTMLVPRELNYLSWLGSQCQGRGRVIELGCFLGGSSAALLDQLPSEMRLISYDAFEIPQIDNHRVVQWLAQYGLSPGEHFRTKFDALMKPYTERMLVHEGWLPSFDEDISVASIYPEQEPVELLFCDIAKTWEVHLSVMHAFGVHLFPGSTLVQQDFFDLQTPWIPLHMWQLRDQLIPLDVIHGTPTASFRCCEVIKPRLASLWNQGHDPGELENAWNDVISYWSEVIGEDAAQVFHGHACQLAIMQGRMKDAVQHGRTYEAWSRTKASGHTYFSPSWDDLLLDVIETGTDCIELRSLAAESIARGSRSGRPRPGDRTNHCADAIRHRVWNSVFEEMYCEPHRVKVLYGAGQHTRWLAEHYADELQQHIDLIIDDSPPTDAILDIPVHKTESLKDFDDSIVVVYPSSDAYETAMRAKLGMHYTNSPNIRIEHVYTRENFANLIETKWQYVVEAVPLSARSASHDRAGVHPVIDINPKHRSQLGLEHPRGWLDLLESKFTPPSWCRDYIRKHECAFMWDFVESTQPHRVVEIGTASGVSSAMLLHALDLFSSPEAQLHSYDIGSKCYFDPQRPLAAAIGEMAPDLIERARTYAGTDASDSSSMYRPQEIDLLLIDGEHAHPAPAVDLLCLAYVIKPGAWVLLHDIELANINNGEDRENPHRSGAGRLYHAWPFEKIQLEGFCPADRNIGAIRFPSSSREAVEALLLLLHAPWESNSAGVQNARAAFSALERNG